MSLTQFGKEVDVEWILKAMRGIRYGEVVLIIHDGQLVRVDTKERKQVNK